MRRFFFPFVLFLLLVVVFFNRQSVYAGCRFFPEIIQNGSFAVADRTGQVIASCNENTPYVPASIIKIPLALAAFDILGKDFRFTTKFYVDKHNNLYIRGYGDPFLVSEEVDLILDRLVERGVETINGIYVDNNSNEPIPGQGNSDNPYDAPVTSLAVNFNTIHIRVLGNRSIESAESQTPTLPIMKELGKDLEPGTYRLNICQDNCSPVHQSNRYTAELFRAVQLRKGIRGSGPLGTRKVPSDISLEYVHMNSRDLQQVVFSFLKYSNNFIANQVFLRCGVERYGKPVTWEKSSRAVNEALLRIVGPEIAKQIRMVEGAGLSRKSSITAIALLRVLEKFKPFTHLMQEKKNIHLKSGTLDGVYNYAGYLDEDRSFVIMLNQELNNRNEILNRLKNNLLSGEADARQ